MSEFLSVGGDERWLDGLHSIPAKLRDLYEINKILAHRPWLITKQHIEVCFHFFFYCVVYDICGGFQLFPCIHLEAVGNLFETYPINQFSWKKREMHLREKCIDAFWVLSRNDKAIEFFLFIG